MTIRVDFFLRFVRQVRTESVTAYGCLPRIAPVRYHIYHMMAENNNGTFVLYVKSMAG